MSRSRTVPISQAHRFTGRPILELSAARIRAWKGYRVITPEGSEDIDTGVFYPSRPGKVTLLAARELKDGVVSILIARDGTPVANRLLCHPQSTITIC